MQNEFEMQKKYSIKLGREIIGFSYLKGNDASMGAVLGKIHFENISSGYDFFSKYCYEHNVPTDENDSEDKFISTQTIDGLTVINEAEIEIKGIGVCVTGFENEFEIDIFGIPYPFYGEEFPHHVKVGENHYRKIAGELSQSKSK